VRERYTAFSSL